MLRMAVDVSAPEMTQLHCICLMTVQYTEVEIYLCPVLNNCCHLANIDHISRKYQIISDIFGPRKLKTDVRLLYNPKPDDSSLGIAMTSVTATSRHWTGLVPSNASSAVFQPKDGASCHPDHD